VYHFFEENNDGDQAKLLARNMSKLKNVMYQRITESRPHLLPTCFSLRFIEVDGFPRRDFIKLEGLSIDNDNAEDENGSTGTDEIFALRYQTECGQASLRYNFTALCETKRNEMKINAD